MSSVTEVLPFSRHLHRVEEGRLVALPEAGEMLDHTFRLAAETGYAPAGSFEVRQPVGYLYRDEGVCELTSWLRGLTEFLRGRSELAPELRKTESPVEIFSDARERKRSILRLYEYAEESLSDLVVVVSARKSFVFWDTHMVEGSVESVPNIGVLWNVPNMGEEKSAPEIWAAERARNFERILKASPQVRQLEIEGLDKLLAREAEVNPCPDLRDILPTRAEILWRPRSLELIDISRLDRWLSRNATTPALKEIAAFVGTAHTERADLALDAFVTDSPEAI
jgi:hypothetical protein